MTTAFLVPSFSKSEKDKVHNTINVPSRHVLVKTASSNMVPAVASEGFSANRDGSYVFVASLQSNVPEEIVTAMCITVGFTSTSTIDSNSIFAYPGYGGINGVCGYGFNGKLCGGNGAKRWYKQYLPSAISSTAKEIIAILTISQNGQNRNVQFIFDGNEGPVHELAKTDFENKNGGNEIFPVLTMAFKGQQLECIPFNQVKSRSPKIDELMKEYVSSNSTQETNARMKKAQKNSSQKPKTAKKIIKKAAKKKVPAKKKNSKKAIKSIKKAAELLT